MTESGVLAQRLEWFAEGEAWLLDLLSSAPSLSQPSLLPGWSRAHVVAHLIGNAAALGNLVHWARTGEPTPMYTDAEARGAQIERDAGRDEAWLRDEARSSSALLAEALDLMTDADWDAGVRTVMGREVSAREIPWMRVRESVVHALDLDLGSGLDRCPAPLVDALLDDTAATVGGREGCPALLVAPDDRDRTWRLGAAGGDEPATVTGSAADLLSWIVGRHPEGRPELPRWL